jgi:hypothetical protein
MLAWMAGKAIAKNQNAVKWIKAVAWVLAAPFIGLAYAVLLPLVGAAMLLWVASKALMTKASVE